MGMAQGGQDGRCVGAAPPEVKRAVVDILQFDVVHTALSVGGGVRRARGGWDREPGVRNNLSGLRVRPSHRQRFYPSGAGPATLLIRSESV